MSFAIEQQARSGLGDLHWLRVAGPFDTRADADAALARRAVRIRGPERVVAVPKP